MRRKSAIELPIEILQALLLIIAVREVGNHDDFGAEILRVLHLLHEGAAAALQQHEEAGGLVEGVQLIIREVFPLEWLAALPILLEWSDDLSNARRALLVGVEADVRQFRADLGPAPKLTLQRRRVDYEQTCIRQRGKQRDLQNATSQHSISF